MNHPLLIDIQRFAISASLYHREEAPETTQTLVKRSLNLLTELPVLRDSIFDYYSLIFEVSIANYISLERNGPQAQPPPNDQAILLIKDGLECLLMDQSWAATYISQWSLSRLIKPSVEFARSMNLDFKGACTLWLGCNAMRCLLDLCGLCFNKFDDVETKRYIYDLENVFADNRPNFDWCVAHLSSLFPLKFISNILRMPSMLTPAFIPSTVTVLEYLSGANEKSLNILLREIIDEALNADQSDLKSKDFIPNLIQLASKSEIYAQAILNVFLEFMGKEADNFIEKLTRQAMTRPLDYNPSRLQTILPELLIRTRENGTKLLLMLAERFDENAWCMELLEVVMTELQSLVFNDKTCPLFDDIRKDSSWPLLWKACVSDKEVLQQTAIRLILTSSSEKHPMLYYKTIEELICTNTTSHPIVFSALVRLLDNPIGINDVPDTKVAISHIVQKLSIDVDNRNSQSQSYFILKNLVDLVVVEKSGQCPYLKLGVVTSALQTSFRMLIHIWEILLRKLMPDVEMMAVMKDDVPAKRIKLEDSDDAMEIADLEEEKVYTTKDQIHMMTHLMDLLNAVGSLNMSDALRCERFTIKYFFWCLTETDEITRALVTDRCFSLLTKQCGGRKGIRAAALRDLLEGALFLYPNLFGAPLHMADKSNIYHKKDESLLKLNQKQGISLNVSRSSILHSGVIGCGVPKVSQPWIPDGLDGDIKNIYVKAIVASCCGTDDNGNNGKIMIEGLSQVSLILIELVSTDVLYNGQSWPEEEFTKVTMERDLHIRRTFKNCPILWSIMGLLAVHKQPLCNCSVFLRALCASVMHHWRAKSTETISGGNSELMFFTVKLLEILSLGQMLPPPLSYLYIVVQHLEPNEIAYVLKECVWNYMVVNGPSIVNAEGFEVHQPQQRGTPAEQFIDPLRNTMQKKLSTLGNLYYQMFILTPTTN